jgi:hypothetical protein
LAAETAWSLIAATRVAEQANVRASSAGNITALRVELNLGEIALDAGA